MRIFIVDDEEVSLFITKRKLILEGISREEDIRTFLSAREALNTLAECREENLPEILLLDLSMPVMDGWKFLDMLACARPAVNEKCRIYILTSSLAPEDEIRAKNTAVLAGFIHKPIGTANIKTIISGAGSNAIHFGR